MKTFPLLALIAPSCCKPLITAGAEAGTDAGGSEIAVGGTGTETGTGAGKGVPDDAGVIVLFGLIKGDPIGAGQGVVLA